MGTLEKEVTLALARSIAAHLEETSRVILTRSDDYLLDIHARTAKANTNRADLFISLHTGGSAAHTTRGINIFYYQLPNGSPVTSLSKSAPAYVEETAAPPWRKIQLRHLAGSRLLAQALQKGLQALDEKQPCELHGAPLAVLQGADMPAVLIELGYLTNPVDEKALIDGEQLSAYAQMIALAVEEFLAKRVALKPKP